MRGIKMPLIEQGRICIVIKGKDAGKEIVIKEVIDKKGYGELFRRAVFGMIPNNRLRSKIIKNLSVTE